MITSVSFAFTDPAISLQLWREPGAGEVLCNIFVMRCKCCFVFSLFLFSLLLAYYLRRK
jgi:hypothetical protein